MAERDWREWSFEEWNRRFFRYFFYADEGVCTPVSRIVVNRDVLSKIAGDASEFGEELESALRDVVRRELRTNRVSLCIDAINKMRSCASDECPPYVLHLMVTCIAASGTGGSRAASNNFRDHLNAFLGRNTQGYFLEDLPRVWESLRTWLNAASEQGLPIRRLVLKDVPSNLKLIGYSINLAFPPRSDQRILNEVILSLNLANDAPVLPILKELAGHSREFTDVFGHALREFERRFLQADKMLFEDPVWSAIQESIATAREVATTGLSSLPDKRFRLRLERTLDWRFYVRVFCDRSVTEELPHGWRTEPSADLAWGEYDHVLTSERIDESEAFDIGNCLLYSNDAVLGSIVGSISRTVTQGVLLFCRDDEGHWALASSMPQVDEVRGLIRDDLLSIFLDALRASGCEPRIRSSKYCGWNELDRITGSDFSATVFDGLEAVDVLKKTIKGPSIVVRGGVRVAGGWIGVKRALPEVSLPDASYSVVMSTPEDLSSTRLRLHAITGRPGVHEVDVESMTDKRVSGNWLVKASIDGQVKATREIAFRATCLSLEFGKLKSPSDWICEGGIVDAAPLNGDGRTPSEVSEEFEGCELSTFKFSNKSNVGESLHAELEDLVDVLAGLCSSRQFVAYGEACRWFNRILEVNEPILWNILRSWEEAGIIDCPYYARWRARAFVARRPRMLLFRSTEDNSVIGTIQGLVTNALRQQIRQTSNAFGVEIKQTNQSSRWVPPPPVLLASSLEQLKGLSDYLGLASPERLLRLPDVLTRIRDLQQDVRELRQNHKSSGYWYSDSGGFRETFDESAIHLERFKRQDVPDEYVVRNKQRIVFHSLSKTWALLAYCEQSSLEVVQKRGSTVTSLVRPGVYLPLVVGRWTTAVTGVCPGIDELGKKYNYTFPDSRSRDDLYRVLWGSPWPKRIDVMRASLERHLLEQSANKVVLPARMRAIFRKSPATRDTAVWKKLNEVNQRLLPRLIRLATELERYNEKDARRRF